jgi:hypothetical protein
MPTSATNTLGPPGGLTPAYLPLDAAEQSCNFADGTYLQGQPVGEVNGNDVQTIAMTATGGTWTASFNGQATGALAYNITKANLATALNALSTVGAGGVAVGGTDGGPYVITFQNQLGNSPQPVLVLGTGSLTGGTATVTHTTPGLKGTMGAYVHNNTDGTGVIRGFCRYGFVASGGLITGIGGPAGLDMPMHSAPVYFRGYFYVQDIANLDATNFLADCPGARVVSGSLASKGSIIALGL